LSVTWIFLDGALTMGLIVAALFFFRFWRRTRDPLFAAFGAAFLILAVAQGLMALSGIPREDQTLLYLLRFCGFGLLIGAIVVKNLGHNGRD
jgi:Family of unknown function (DUF5985)